MEEEEEVTKEDGQSFVQVHADPQAGGVPREGGREGGRKGGKC